MASLTDEIPNQLSLEKGCHGSNSGNLVQYKKRKVSALRSFPPRCGTNAEPITPEALLDVMVCIDDDHAALAAHANSVQSGINVVAQSCVLEENQSNARGLEASGEMELQENVAVQHPDSVAAALGDNGVETEAKKCPDALETDDLRLPKVAKQNNVGVTRGGATCAVFESNAAKTETVVDSSISTLAMEVSFDEALGYPIFMEENVSLDDFVGDALAMVMDNIDNEIKETAYDLKPLQVELLEDMKGNSMDLVKELSGDDAEVKSTGGEEVNPSSETGVVADVEIPVAVRDFQTPKDKFRQRKVSAIRDFPPNCGTNGPPLTEMEHTKIFYETESLAGSKMLYLQHELHTSKEALESGNLRKILSDRVEASGSVKETNAGTEEIEGNLTEVAITDDYDQGDGFAGKEIFLDAPDTSSEGISSDKVSSSGRGDKYVMVTALMAAPNCPWVQQKVSVTSEGRKSEGRVDMHKADWRNKPRVVAKKSSVNAYLSKISPIKKQKILLSARKDAAGTSQVLAARDGGRSGAVDLPTGHRNGFTVNFPPFGASSSHTTARSKVREILRSYQTICRKLLQREEAKSGKFDKIRRIDLEAAKILKEEGVEVNTDKDRVGSVPGVEVGDEFQYRVELAIVGVHRLYQAGIDFIKQKGTVIATSIVASGAYADGWDNADVLIYSGQGGNIVGKKKEPEDQKLERGNLALTNSAKTKNPVRVVRGSKETKASDSLDSRSKVLTTYVYDGLYTVEKCWPETGPHGKMVYMFELRRIPGQPELAWKEVKNAIKAKVRRGVCIPDISGGKETIPICVVNIIDNEKPPPFTYIRRMKYPDGFRFIPPQGCGCTTRCSDSGKCSCKLRNGGELPYNRNGALVETKPLVYECGPSCKCPPSCYNRVSQHGIKIQLELFKTENRGWGVRSLSSISSGSYICEYAGDLLEDKEAEQRTGSDEYLFDIGKNYGEEDYGKATEEAGYTVDAAVYGNVGRFINHSCSPNLHAQDVLYDHDDKRMPHVMLFAVENIPPMQELTYHYHYKMNQVYDVNGNIKMKSCYCGSVDCTGRMY